MKMYDSMKAMSIWYNLYKLGHNEAIFIVLYNPHHVNDYSAIMHCIARHLQYYRFSSQLIPPEYYDSHSHVKSVMTLNSKTVYHGLSDVQPY